MFNIKEELSKLPEKPGIYIMKDENDNVIYVGKAVNLKNRVRQYFQSPTGQTPKVQLMVSKIKSFEYIVTNSEIEALVLECNLIKRYKPKYNILLKDDKTYPYIKVTVDEEYPRVFITRNIKKDKAKYFGPYPNVSDVKQIMNFLKKVFPVRSCSKDLSNSIGKGRPCLNYYIGRCTAPCQGMISKEEYAAIIKDICSFLGGRYEELLSKLQKEMQEAAENMEFEKAAALRDKIQSISNMFQEQKVLSTSFEDQDVIAMARKDNYACIQIFFMRSGKLIGRESFLFDDVQENDAELMSSFIKQFYSTSELIPGEIIAQVEIDDMKLIEDWLKEKRGGNVNIKVPKRGEKLKLVNMASENAKIYLENVLQPGKTRPGNVNIKADGENINLYGENAEVLVKLADLLKLDTIPSRIEAYDISNTGSSEITGSLVVFEDAQPAPKNYRRFKIKTVQDKQNDYASMQEMLFRRFRKGEEFLEYPDLILVDGGLGHVNAALEVLRFLNLDIPVFGMVKDNKHNTRGLVSLDGEYELSGNMQLYRFIASIQNEAHRFAIQYNRKLREKRYRQSVLDEIPGIGEKRKKDLLRHFGSISRIKNAKIEELMAVEGISRKVAENIYNYFNSDSNEKNDNYSME